MGLPFTYHDEDKSVHSMMKFVARHSMRIFVSVIFSGFVGIAFSQSITISEELPFRNDYAYTVLGWVGGDLLMFRDKGHEFFIQAFDEELHVKWEREILLGPHKADIIGVTSTPDRIHLIYGVRHKNDYYVQHRSYDHAIDLIDTVNIAIIENIFISPIVQMVSSEDESKIVVYHEDGDGLQLTSYDLITRTVLWNYSLKLSGSNLQRDYSSIEVTNSGEFYLILEPGPNQQKVQSLELFCSIPGADQLFHDKIDMGNQQVYDCYTQFDNLHKDLVITGLYSDHNTSRAQGFYFLRYQPGLGDSIHLLPFDESLLTEVNGKEVAVSKGLTDFNVQKVALRQDGGAVVIAELNKEFSRRSSMPVHRDPSESFAHGGWVDYYYEDLILFAINPDGSEHWKKVLRKRQYSQDDEAMYSSFFLFKTSAQLRFLFNDEIKQENTVGGYVVTGTGDVERKTVFNTDYQRLKLRFKDGLQVAYNECIVPSERNNRLNLVRIQF